MTDESTSGVPRRTVLRGLGTGVGVAALSAAAEATPADPERVQEALGNTDPKTQVTFAALVDAVIPETPNLADLDKAPVEGGLEVGLEEFLITYVNTLFQHGAPGIGHVEDLRLSEVVGVVLDAAATELLARTENVDPPGDYAPEGEDWTLGGPFARLSRDDRVRALALFDEDERDFHTADLPGPVAEGDAGIVPQLVVAFTEVVYYSEWQGYEDGKGLTAPPSEREHPNTPEAVQSWRQTGFPGNADGYQALRGYASPPGSSLGGGRTWKVIETREGDVEETKVERVDEGQGATVLQVTVPEMPESDGSESTLRITVGPGEFEDNDYDTSGYDERDMFPETGGHPSELPAGGVSVELDGEVESGPVGLGGTDVGGGDE